MYGIERMELRSTPLKVDAPEFPLNANLIILSCGKRLLGISTNTLLHYRRSKLAKRFYLLSSRRWSYGLGSLVFLGNIYPMS